MKIHELANAYPELGKEEFEILVADIRENGLRVPILIHENQIIDGKHRYKACLEAGVEPRFEEWDGEGSLVDLVISLNSNRRHLTVSQKAAIAVELLPYLENEGKERMKLGSMAVKGEKQNKGRTILFQGQPPSSEGRSSAKQAGETVGVSPQYIKEAKKIAKEAPEVIKAVKVGKINIPEAKKIIALSGNERTEVMEAVNNSKKPKKVKQVIKDVKQKNRDEKAKDIDTQSTINTSCIKVNPGDFWKLGKHILYCGDTGGEEFTCRVPKAAFAFADPPYNAGAAEWDNAFVWQHDYLAEKAEVVVVTPGINTIAAFFATKTKMPYLWSIACWINNGMTRGAMGFGNWIYAAVFSQKSIHRNTQDFLKVSIKSSETSHTSHKGRKPKELLLWLIETFSAEGDIVIDPFLGSGTTLLVAESLGRVCFGGEILPQFCAETISRWEKQTKQKAELISDENEI